MVIQSHKQIFYKGVPQKAAYLGSNYMWPKEIPEEPAPIDYSEPFYVENTSSQTRSLTVGGAPHYYGYGQTDWDLYTSNDKVNWTLVYEFRHPFYYQDVYSTILMPHEKLYMIAECNTFGAWYRPEEASYTLFYNSKIRGGFSTVGGNILSMFYGSSFDGTQTEFPDSGNNNACHLYQIFAYNTSLVDASKLIIPVKTLHPCSCREMFLDCSNLIYPPVCDFDTFVNTPYIYDEGKVTKYCYGMFFGCKNLAYVPDAVKNAPV